MERVRIALVFLCVAVGACVRRAAPPPKAAPAKPAEPTVVVRPQPSGSCSVESGSRRAAVVDDALRRFGKAKELAATGEDKDLKAATDQMVQLTQDYPWLALAHNGVGQLQTQRRNWIAAYTAYDRVLGFPSHPADRERVTAQLRMLEERQPALRAYGDAERSVQAKDLAKAEQLARNVIEQKPQFPLAHRLLGDMLAQSPKRSAEAVSAYEQYLKLDPFSPDRDRIDAWLLKSKGLPSK